MNRLELRDSLLLGQRRVIPDSIDLVPGALVNGFELGPLLGSKVHCAINASTTSAAAPLLSLRARVLNRLLLPGRQYSLNLCPHAFANRVHFRHALLWRKALVVAQGHDLIALALANGLELRLLLRGKIQIGTTSSSLSLRILCTRGGRCPALRRDTDSQTGRKDNVRRNNG